MLEPIGLILDQGAENKASNDREWVEIKRNTSGKPHIEWTDQLGEPRFWPIIDLEQLEQIYRQSMPETQVTIWT